MSQVFDAALHKRHLSQLLAETNKRLAEKIAFKGGTCALFFYNLPRLSFDLDYDVLSPLAEADIDGIKEILSRHGTIREFYEKRFTTFFLFDYGKGHPNIKLEFNKRVWENNVYKQALFLGVPITIADESTTLTNKLVALTNRKTAVARDLFDSWYFLNAGFSISEPIVFERTELHLKDYLKKAIGFIEKTYNRRNIIHGLGDALDESQKDWARAKLRTEAIFLLRARLESEK